MTTTSNPVSSALDSLTIASKTASTNKSTNSLNQDTFLKLMMAQIQYQDPTKPVDSSQFLTQLSQVGQLTAMNQLEASFSALASAMQSSQALQASTLVGRSVRVAGSQMATASAGTPIAGAVQLDSAASNVTLNVFNTAGSLVKQIALGDQAAGQVPFTWEGMNGDGTAAPAGTYKFTATGDVAGSSTSLSTLLDAKVDSVSLNSGGEATLNLVGLGSVGISSVQQVR